MKTIICTLLILLFSANINFAGQGMGPGPGLSRVTAAANEPDTGFETGTLEGYTGPSAIVGTAARTGSYSYFAGEELPAGTYGVVLSKSVNLSAGNGTMWVYRPDVYYPSNTGVRIKLNGTQVGSVSLTLGSYTEIGFTVATPGTYTLTVEAQSGDWDDSGESGTDNWVDIDDINYP